MGFFTSRKIFSTQRQIRQTLYKIKSLDYKERAKVFEVFKQDLDNGGVTTEELKESVRKLRLKKSISEIDKSNLLELLK